MGLGAYAEQLPLRIVVLTSCAHGVPRIRHCDLFRHVFRKVNRRADSLARRASAKPHAYCISRKFWPRSAQLHFDGGHVDADGGRVSISAWTLRAAAHRLMGDDLGWIIVAERGPRLIGVSSSVRG